MKRKSLSETISPDVREFIEAGTPKPQIAESGEGNAELKAAEDKSARQPMEKLPPPETDIPLTTQSYRLPKPLVNALVRASMERKIARQRPWSQQDIVAEAVSQWLRKHASK